MDYFSKSLEPLYCALGKIVYVWSHIETSLDFDIALIFFFFYRKNIAEKQEIPRSLNMKIKFLKKAFRNITQLKPLMDQALIVIKHVSSLSKNRHDIIHGVLCGMNPNSYKFSKLDHAKEICNINVRNITFTLDDLHHLGNEMMDLLIELNELDSLLLPILPKP
jgi:ABC-type siderophore export system fused ATPase/permease subunit